MRLINASTSGTRNSRGCGLPDLRLRRDRADFDETETERAERIDVASVLIEARGESEAIRKAQAHQRHGALGSAFDCERELAERMRDRDVASCEQRRASRRCARVRHRSEKQQRDAVDG